MDHNIFLSGHYYELRPVRMDDAEFMVSLRTDPELSKFLNNTSSRVEDQKHYLERYLTEPDDYYFIIQSKSMKYAEGIVAIYEIDHNNHCAEWGRWIIRKGSMAAIESACLIYRIAFESLKLGQLYCRTVSENRSVVSFHESCGLRFNREIPDYVKINGVTYNSIEQSMTAKDWPQHQPKLEEKSERIARLLDR